MPGLSQVLLIGIFILTALTGTKASTPAPSKIFNPHGIQNPKLNSRSVSRSRRQNLTNWTYRIPSTIQNGTAQARLNISTPNKVLTNNALLSLERPQISKVTPASFDWWYFDAISSSNSHESLTITLFSASARSFPWLDPTEESVLIAYLWATFANGSSFSDYIPATLASVSGGVDGSVASAGTWSNTGFSWLTTGGDLSKYEIIIESEEMGVYGTFKLESELTSHLPCGIESDTTTLEIVPSIGWTSLIPDANGTVDLRIQGTSLNFQGRGYHDKNWSNQPFTSNVQSWYWGHGKIGPYSIVWFSAIAADNQTYISSYVSRDGNVLVSSCDSASASVRPLGAAGTTGGRYPPMAGDTPTGFFVETYLGENEGLLRVNVSIVGKVTGDGTYYMRWTGTMSGTIEGKSLSGNGVAVFEQFVLVE